MFKFITKVWMAGEINDFRRDRKKRKAKERQIRKERRIRNVAEIGMVDEIVKNDEVKKKEWETVQNKLVISALTLFVSLIASFVFIPLFFVALIDLIYMIIITFKYEKIKKRNLNNK